MKDLLVLTQDTNKDIYFKMKWDVIKYDGLINILDKSDSLDGFRSLFRFNSFYTEEDFYHILVKHYILAARKYNTILLNDIQEAMNIGNIEELINKIQTSSEKRLELITNYATTNETSLRNLALNKSYSTSYEKVYNELEQIDYLFLNRGYEKQLKKIYN